MSTSTERTRILAAAQARPGQIALALAVALLGFLLATQYRASESLAGRLSAEREEDLAKLLGDLQEQSDALVEEVVGLRVELAQAQSAEDRDRLALESARKRLTDLRLLLGLVAARGEGVQITITDPERTVGPDLLVDAVQELRDAGAEAIQVNTVRVIASTSFSGDAGAIKVDRTTTISGPYVIRAIGPRSTLAEAMRIPGGVVDAVASRPGAAAEVAERTEVLIAALRTAPRFSYATRS